MDRQSNASGSAYRDANDEADLCAHLLVVLRKLEANWKESALLYRDIRDFICEHGGQADEEELESLSDTFYRQVNRGGGDSG